MNWRALPPLASLRAFAAYAESGSLTAAAKALGVSHPAISQQIRALEQHLGLALVSREGRAMALTAEGHMLATAANEAFGAIADVVETLTGAEDARPVHVTTTPSFAAAWLMPRLATLRVAHPEIEVMLNPTPGLVPLEPGGVDIAIRYGKGGWAGLETEMLVETPMVLVAAPRLLAGRPHATHEDMAQLPWLEEFGASEGSMWLNSRGVGIERKGPSVHVPGNLLLDGARDGQGVAVTVKCFVEPDLMAERLVLLDESTDEGAGYHLVTRPGVHRASVKAFLKWLRRVAK